MKYVYILISSKDKNKYIGFTSRTPEIRLQEHNNVNVKATKSRRPLNLFGYLECETIIEAAELERKYKKSSGALDRAIKKGKFILTNIGA